MSKDTSLTYSLYGKDVSATKALKNVGQAAKETGGSFSKIKDIAAGIFSAHLLEKAGAELIGFAKESLTAFTDIGKEVAKTQRMVGGTVEDASKLRFAFVESGLTVDKAQMSIKKFAQAIDSNNKNFKALHVSTKDAHGQQKSFNEILLDTAEKFKNMPNGIHKTAMAVNLFGRTGLDMLKFLNKGKQGLQELEDEAQKYGLVLTKDNMEAVSQSIEAHKKLHAALSGVQVQIGAHLTPLLTKATVAFTTIFPIILKYINPAFKMLATFLAPVITYYKEMATFLLQLGKHFITSGGHMDRFKDIIKSVVAFSKTLVQVMKAVLDALKPVYEFVAKYLAPVLLFVLQYAFKAIAWAATLIVPAIHIVVNVFKFLIAIVKGVGTVIKDIFMGIVGFIKGYINAILTIVNFVIGVIDKIHFKIPSWIPKIGGKEFGIHLSKIPMLAEGGIANKPTLAMIGEAGPEAVIPLNRAHGFGGGMNVIIHVAGSVITEKDLALKVRNEIGQLMRRRGLPVTALGL
jgi:hypothetical protein